MHLGPVSLDLPQGDFRKSHVDAQSFDQFAGGGGGFFQSLQGSGGEVEEQGKLADGQFELSAEVFDGLGVGGVEDDPFKNQTGGATATDGGEEDHRVVLLGGNIAVLAIFRIGGVASGGDAILKGDEKLLGSKSFGAQGKVGAEGEGVVFEKVAFAVSELESASGFYQTAHKISAAPEFPVDINGDGSFLTVFFDSSQIHSTFFQSVSPALSFWREKESSPCWSHSVFCQIGTQPSNRRNRGGRPNGTLPGSRRGGSRGKGALRKMWSI